MSWLPKNKQGLYFNARDSRTLCYRISLPSRHLKCINFSMQHHIEILNREWIKRRSANSSFSLRSYALFLDVSPSGLSDFLAGKKGFSRQTTKKIVEKLELSHDEGELFEVSISAHHSKSRTVKGDAQKKLRRLGELASKYKIRNSVEESILSSWQSFAILECITLKDFDQTEKWISNKLGLNIFYVRSTLNELIKMGWLSFENMKYQIHVPASKSTEDVPSEMVKNYHRQILKKSEKSLDEVPLLEREFITTTLAIRMSEVQEAKKYLRDFQREFTFRFCDSEPEKDSVFQFSIQFFKLHPTNVKETL